MQMNKNFAIVETLTLWLCKLQNKSISTESLTVFKSHEHFWTSIRPDYDLLAATVTIAVVVVVAAKWIVFVCTRLARERANERAHTVDSYTKMFHWKCDKMKKKTNNTHTLTHKSPYLCRPRCLGVMERKTYKYIYIYKGEYTLWTSVVCGCLYINMCRLHHSSAHRTNSNQITGK